MTAISKQEADTLPVEFTLNGKPVVGRSDETILLTARRYGVDIPTLCYKEGYRADGNCRACMVEIDGERVLAPSCCRFPKQGMEVSSESERAVASQKMVVELLLSDMPEKSYKLDSELDIWAKKLKVENPRFPGRPQPRGDSSHPAMWANLDACIQCTRCVRACREEQVNDVIGYAFRNADSKIVFDLDDAWGTSTCVGCGECVQACPTGALSPAREVALEPIDKVVNSVCPFCGVGCQLTYHVKDNKIMYVDGRDGPANHSRLCVKGRYGFDYADHRHRLTKPLIRKPGVPKSGDFKVDPDNWGEAFREATWEEAMEVAANGLKKILDRDGPDALAGFGCAKGTNEEAYLLQKMVRTAFHNNNVDHCTRFCHASSVAALLEGIGSGAVSNPVRDVSESEVVMLIGSNPTVNHPVAATWMKNAMKRGTKFILCDPRRTELSRFAEYTLQFKPSSDVAMLNALLNVIVTENLVDEKFIKERTTDYEALRKNIQQYTPEKMAEVCGIPAQTLREVARLFATSKASMIIWGMGISQHTHGTDNARCLIALSMITGQIGRPGTGLHPIRGQNNVQGASDVGLIPMVYPDYQPVTDPKAQARFEKLWGTKLDPRTGLTAVEIMNAAHAHKIKGIYIMGENPAMSDPNANHVREALSRLEHLVVQDIFLTETAYHADVILPATAWPEKTGTVTNTDRTVQMGRQALTPPGEARQDLDIIVDLANRLGLHWTYKHPSEVFNEMRQAMDSIAGITWERLDRDSAVTYPCEKEGDPGEPIVFIDDFPTKNGLAKIVPADILPPAESPDENYPFVLTTGRQLEHWHTGTMTRRASMLDALEPEPVVYINPDDVTAMGLKPGDVVTVTSRRGEVALYTRVDEGMPCGVVFIAFCYYEAASNRLTNDALDPYGKIPEAKYCAVRVTPGGKEPVRMSFGHGQAMALA